MEEVGVDKFAAIVSDNGANVKGARNIISQKHPHIFSVRCIAHCLNLLSHDIVSYSFADRLIKKCNALATFFKRATRAGKYFDTFQVAKFLVFMVHTFSCLLTYYLQWF